MPLNATEQERRRTAAADLALKLKLERRAQVELKEFFRMMSKDIGASVSSTGSPPNAQEYSIELSGILTRQYRRTGEAFNGRITDFLTENLNNEENEPILAILALLALAQNISPAEMVNRIDDNTRKAFREFTLRNVEQQTREITRTNSKEMGVALATSTAILFDQLGEQPTNRQLGRKTATEFNRRSQGRIPTIAATVTQNAAEGMKHIERDSFFNARNNINRILVSVPAMKEREVWVTVGDNRVRSSHGVADGQEKEGGVFTVQGQSLRFPGDPSLGATADNIINCRCAAVPVLEDSIDAIPILELTG